MAFSVKDWKDWPNSTTPLNATAMEDMETRLSNYVDSQVGGSGTDTTARLIAGAPMAVGFYYSAPFPSFSNFVRGHGTMTMHPFIIGRACTLDRIAIRVSSAGSANSVHRLGIYSDVNGVPTSLILDAGTVDTTTSGIKEITISQSMSVGLYWLACAQQGNPTTSATVTGSNAFGSVGWAMSQNGTHFSQALGFTTASLAVTGALPSSPPTLSAADTMLSVNLRASS